MPWRGFPVTSKAIDVSTFCTLSLYSPTQIPHNLKFFCCLVWCTLFYSLYPPGHSKSKSFRVSLKHYFSTICLNIVPNFDQKNLHPIKKTKTKSIPNFRAKIDLFVFWSLFRLADSVVCFYFWLECGSHWEPPLGCRLSI